jgi:hypothetical protein
MKDTSIDGLRCQRTWSTSAEVRKQSFSRSRISDNLSSMLACYFPDGRQKGLRTVHGHLLFRRTAPLVKNVHARTSVWLIRWIVPQMSYRITFTVSMARLPLFDEKQDTYKHLSRNKCVGWRFQVYAVPYSSHNSRCLTGASKDK